MTALYSGRDHSVPCQEIGCRRFTFDDDALCARHKSAVASSPGRGEAGARPWGHVPPPAGSSLLSLTHGTRVGAAACPGPETSATSPGISSGGTVAVGFLSTVRGHDRPVSALAAGSSRPPSSPELPPT